MLWEFCALLAVHYVADFMVQTDWQARNKSQRLDALGIHVLTYTVCFAAVSFLLFGWSTNVVKFILLNGGCHFVTDYFTARASSVFFRQQPMDFRHGMMVVGADQLVHQMTIAVTIAIYFT